MEIAQGIEGLRAAARSVGAAVPERRHGGAADRLEHAVWDLSPLCAPADLPELFARCDADGLPVQVSPVLLDFQSSHQLWSGELARMPNAVPRCLFPIAHDRMSFLFVELGGPHGQTERVGSVWSWSFGAQWFDLIAPSIGEWLGLLARAVTTGAYAVHADPVVLGRSRIAVPSDAVAALAATRMRRARTSPGHTGARISARAHLWPDRWLAASGVTPEMRRSGRGALAIADLIERAAARPLAATITGEVADIVGHDDGVYALTVDEDHELWVYCPSSVSVLGPRLQRPFEFDVTAGPWPGGERRRRLLDPGWLGAALARRMQSGPRVVAQAVRPASP